MVNPNLIHSMDAAMLNSMRIEQSPEWQKIMEEVDLEQKEEPIEDHPCAWCNDEGPETDDGESHPCAFCGAMS